MPIVRQLVQKVVIGKMPGHQPATLQVHGLIASILTPMDLLMLLERRFLAEPHADFAGKKAGEIDTEAKKQKVPRRLSGGALGKYPEWENLSVSLVAGGPESTETCTFHFNETAEAEIISASLNELSRPFLERND
jgi:hypothetical protein